MSQEYPHNRRAAVSALSKHSLEEQDLDAADALGPPVKLLVVDRPGSFSADIERTARALQRAPSDVAVSRLTPLLVRGLLGTPEVVLAAPEEVTATRLGRLAQLLPASPK